MANLLDKMRDNWKLILFIISLVVIIAFGIPSIFLGLQMKDKDHAEDERDKSKEKLEGIKTKTDSEGIITTDKINEKKKIIAEKTTERDNLKKDIKTLEGLKMKAGKDYVTYNNTLNDYKTTSYDWNQRQKSFCQQKIPVFV